MIEQAVTLGEVARLDLPPLRAEQQRAAHVEWQAAAQSAPWSGPSANAGATSSPTPIVVLPAP